MSDRYYGLAMTKKPPAPSDVADKFMLRMPEGMRDRIAAKAEKNHRSMNAEIVARLEESLGADEKYTVQQIKGLLDADATEAIVKEIQRAAELAIARVAEERQATVFIRNEGLRRRGQKEPKD
ncbi:Arc family DNA-binding protein [Microvirga aerilata]